MAAGIHLGDNTFAALVTRGLSELTRLGVELGGKQETFYGLSRIRGFNSNLFKRA